MIPVLEGISFSSKNSMAKLTKIQLQEKLAASGVEFDPKATNSVLEKLLVKAEKAGAKDKDAEDKPPKTDVELEAEGKDKEPEPEPETKPEGKPSKEETKTPKDFGAEAKSIYGALIFGAVEVGKGEYRVYRGTQWISSVLARDKAVEMANKLNAGDADQKEAKRLHEEQLKAQA